MHSFVFGNYLNYYLTILREEKRCRLLYLFSQKLIYVILWQKLNLYTGIYYDTFYYVYAFILDEEHTFALLQGHDTVAMGICFSLLLLAEHKDVQVFLFYNIN